MAVCVAFAQPDGGFVNTYADPWLPFAALSSQGAPATSVLPEIAIEVPRRSPTAPSEAVSLARSKNGSICSG